MNYLTTVHLKRASIHNTFRYVGSSYEGNNQSGDKIESRLLWDIRVTVPIRQMDLYVGLNDATNKRYHERSGYPLPGRTFYGGISLRLWG